jgi:hypothetical protein
LDRRAFRVNAGGRIVPAIHIPDPRRTQKVEGDERGHEAAALGHERMEVAPPVVHKHDRFAVDQRPTHRQTANRLGESSRTDR